MSELRDDVSSLRVENIAGMRGLAGAGAMEAVASRMPRWARHFYGKCAEYTRLRMKLASFFILRGLGIRQPRTLDASLLPEGLTLILPGIESESIFTYGMCDGLQDGGVRGAIRVFNWGMPFPGGYLANLTWIDRNRKRAADIAAEIVAYQDAYPGRPVHLVAQSGGAGIAVFAAEALPEGRTIDGIVLLGGALSPEYNLSKALRKCRKGILNSYSERDSFILGWGTMVFGTTDRRFTKACGCVGFRKPGELTEEEGELYDRKLTQLAWSAEMADTCHHFGGHLSSGCETFLERRIAPWVRG